MKWSPYHRATHTAFALAVAVVAALPLHKVAAQTSWTGGFNNIWINVFPQNWTNGAPDAVNEVVTLGDIVTAPSNVLLMSLNNHPTYSNYNPRVGTLNIVGDADYNIFTSVPSSSYRTPRLRFSVSSGSASLNISGSNSSTIDSSLNVRLVDSLEINHSGSGDFTIAANIDENGTRSLTHNGTGTTILSGSNTYSGGTTVNGGTLELKNTTGGTPVSGPQLTLNSGGTLLLSANEQINDSTALTLDGGTFSTGTGFSETLGPLTLTSNSSIDLGSNPHLLSFSSSSLPAWNGTLTIYGWHGSPGQSGTQGQIFFGNTSTGLTPDQLGRIHFDGFSTAAMLNDAGELVPTAVPEAQTVLAALCLAGWVFFRERHRLRAILSS